ncbi:transcriptional regulator, LacI family [Melghirimyces thermohalophilus]|uniref:Transcriptional regulator, LacI family n=1 Tax=Melghirimyces thermohalophilus TaxID=1236220 RepID=A0A1G6NVS1_9BACL|nr:LacI family DNA-binding transcriptional regulator [Melghirimyces thermohalophilus]SDC72130.1 transcriptional regulator, LacI family [Melghirimyces thermohalophilus]
MKRINLNEVAKRAGVSAMTVSRVINHKDHVAPKTREKINRVIRDLRYEPHAIAQSLASRKTRILGVAVYGEENTHPAFYHQILKGFRRRVAEKGYDVLIFSEKGDIPLSRRVIGSQLAQGVLLAGAHIPEEEVEVFRKARFPFAVIGRPDVKGAIPCVALNYRETFAQVTRSLIEAGNRRIAFVANAAGFPADRDKYLGYLHAHREAGIPAPPSLARLDVETQQDGLQAVKGVLSAQPSAILFGNTNATFGGFWALQAGGSDWDPSLSLIAFDDNGEMHRLFADTLSGTLGSIGLPKERLGVEAADLLIRQLDQPCNGEQIWIPLELRGVQVSACGES